MMSLYRTFFPFKRGGPVCGSGGDDKHTNTLPAKLFQSLTLWRLYDNQGFGNPVAQATNYQPVRRLAGEPPQQKEAEWQN